MADAFGTIVNACSLVDLSCKLFKGVKKLLVRGRTVAQKYASVQSAIDCADENFTNNTVHFTKHFEDVANQRKNEVKRTFDDIQKPPFLINSSTCMAKVKLEVSLIWFGIRYGKDVHRKLVTLENGSLEAYKNAVKLSKGKTTHVYIEGTSTAISIPAAVGFDRAQKVLDFIENWLARPVSATMTTSSSSAPTILPSKLCFIGIVGQGGLGKTTLLEYIFHKISKNFQKTAWIEMLDNLDGYDLKSIQASLINQLMEGVETYEGIQTAHCGKDKLRSIFEGIAKSGKYVCIIIDDVWTPEDLEKLLPIMNIPALSCCVLVASQVQDVMRGLNLASVHKNDCCSHTFQLEHLSEEASKELLLAHATHVDDAQMSTLVNNNLSTLVEEVHPFCCNLPKALKLTGKKLAERQDTSFWDQWKSAMAEDKPGVAAGFELLNNLLDRGYKKLNPNSKVAICGIATCFHGWPKHTVINIAGELEIDNIQRYSLIPFGVLVESSLKMQGLLRKLAHACAESHKDIIWDLRQNWPISRLEDKDFEKVKYLHLDAAKAREFQDYLAVAGSCFEHMEHLLALDMFGSFNFTGLLQFPKSLRFLRFQQNYSLQGFENMEFPSSLQQLEFDGCGGLRELPAATYNCGSLICLRIVGCRELKGLRGGGTKWMKLEVLWLEECPNITRLPLEDLRKLQRVIINQCEDLEASQADWKPMLSHASITINKVSSQMPSGSSQPSSCSLRQQLAQHDPRAAPSVSPKSKNSAKTSISQLRNMTGEQVASLTHLTISACGEPRQEWSPSVEMKCLRQLKLKNCGWIELEPSLFARMRHLTNLSLIYCKQLVVLPCSLGSLMVLEELILKMCHKLGGLPDTIGNLKSLRKLEVEGCGKLERLPHTVQECASLEELSLEACNSLECLPHDMHNLKSLKIMRLSHCTKLNRELLSTSVGSLAIKQLVRLELVGLYSQQNEVPEEIENVSRLTIVVDVF